MKKIVIISFSILIALTACEQKTEYKGVDLGEIKDVWVVPTSSNECIKTQIKTDSVFFVVKGLPCMLLHKRLIGYFKNGKLDNIHDWNGNKFEVQ